MSTLHQIIIVALTAAFIILFLGKTGLRTKFRDWNDRIGIKVVASALDCDFCLSFWTCLVIALIIWLFGYEEHFIVLLCAPPITRYLI